MKSPEYPSTICHECGIKYGKPKDGVSTYHIGECAWCGQTKEVTEPRDYGYPEWHQKEDK